jgi:hypothetical protein
MISPYSSYIFAFSLALAVYQLSWSELYPEISISLLFFLIFTFIAFFTVKTTIYKPSVSDSFYYIPFNPNVARITYFILVCWIMEFIYNRGVPLLLIIQGYDYNYTGFGIPSFHVFVVSFSSFWTVYTFHMYISTWNKRVLVFFLINIFCGILVFNRAMVLMNSVSCLFIYIASISESLNFIKFVTIVSKVSALALSLLFIFGSLGNLRTEKLYDRSQDENIILEIGKAKDNFRNSLIPTEFFWTYLYTSSPIANLQTTIDRSPSELNELNIQNTISFSINEILPDFLSKRANQLYQSNKRSGVLIDDQFTVSTVYSGSYANLNWFGMMIMTLFISTFPVVYRKRLENNRRENYKQNIFKISGMAILNTLYFFLIFDNMFIFSGLSFQLVYPLILNHIFNSTKNTKNVV